MTQCPDDLLRLATDASKSVDNSHSFQGQSPAIKGLLSAHSPRLQGISLRFRENGGASRFVGALSQISESGHFCLYLPLLITSSEAEAAKKASDMGKLDDADKTTAGAAALSICESLIALSDLNVIGNRETLAVLNDAAATHRNAITLSPNPDEHRAIAALIQRIIESRNSVLQL